MRTMLVGFAAAAAVGSGPTAATILTFDIARASFESTDLVPPTYGDRVTATTMTVGGFTFGYGMGDGFTPNVTVDYWTRLPNGNARNNLAWWGPGLSYADLVNVAYANAAKTGRNAGLGTAEIWLIPDPGYRVRLNSFALAAYDDFHWFTGDQPVSVRTASGALLWDPGPVDLDDTSAMAFFPDAISAEPIVLSFGLNWNVGIDNVSFDQIPIPAPASAALLATALLAWRLWRRS